ncbi:MAG: asparagine synthase [Sphingobium sp.]|nr:asparagine synthase [Sphingobium sp.]
MAPEYLLLVSDDPVRTAGIAAQIQVRLGVPPAYMDGRLAAFRRGANAILALDSGGCVIGTLFHRFGPPRAIERLDDPESQRILASFGRELVDRYWGAYIAAIEHEGLVRVIRDPSGALPCYHTGFDGGVVFANDADMLVASGLAKPSPSWPALARGLYVKDLPNEETALVGVTELLPGTAFIRGNDYRGTAEIWSPWNYVVGGGEARADTVESLRRTVQSTVSAWASCYDGVLCAVSGGLDSSIVAACLAAGPRAPELLTISTTDVDGDELFFAEILARGLGCDLRAEALDLADIAIDRAAAPHLPRPVSRTQSLSYDKIVARVAAESGADCLFTGNGGDNVFGFSYSATSIYDRLRGEGIGGGLLRTLSDICTLTGASPWQALTAAGKVARRRSPRYRWKPSPEFLHPDVLADNQRREPAHRWLAAPEDALPGKAVHISLLLLIQQHLQANERTTGLPVINPLMSQPVVEACLRIPSWEWCAGGVNRSIARQAFATQLPAPLIQRRSKGTPESFCVEIIEAHRAAIRDHLADGTLAAHGVVDAEAIACRLADDAPTLSSTQRLLELVEAEAWARTWETAAENAAGLVVPARSVATS